MLHNLNIPKFDGTNIVKSVTNVEDVARQYLYPDGQILNLFKQLCATPSLARDVEKITAGDYSWSDQKKDLLTYFKAEDKASRADPTEIIEDIIRNNPDDNLDDWKQKIADYNQPWKS